MVLMISRWQVGVPSAAERADIFQKQLRFVPCGATREEVAQLADAAHGYVGADLAAVCREAGKSSRPDCSVQPKQPVSDRNFLYMSILFFQNKMRLDT